MIIKDLEADLTGICLCLVWMGLISAAAAASLSADMLFSQMVFCHRFLSQVRPDKDIYSQGNDPDGR